MSIVNAITTSLYSRLSAGTALTNALGGTYIYHMQAPDGAALPYVVYSQVSGGDLNETPNREKSQLYFIRAYAASMGAAGTLDALVDALMRTNLSVSGWSTYWTAREDDFTLVENPTDQSKIFMAGAYYRVSLSEGG